MTPIVLTLALIGVGYISELLMRFIVWLDGADECAEDLGQAADNAADRLPAKENRKAA